MADDTEQLERIRSALVHRYEIKRELGRGGMSTVYLAEETRHSRHLALKVLLPELAATIGADRFLREIKTTASLTHPHILPLFDSGEVAGFLYYVMPYVEGESLRDRLKRETQLPIEDALRITADIADALGFAHSRNVIHRDIKPENILLEAGHAIVADFGIAKAVTEAGADALTDTGLAIGTPQYMSPEQATASPHLDGRSDMYSLACVLFEMLAGDPPFAGTARQSILARKSIEPAPSLRHVRATVPAAVELAVARALERVPADRFRTMQQFVDALSATEPSSRESKKAPGAVPTSAVESLEAEMPIQLKPLEDEVDVFGLTHPGKVQKVNQEHFLIFSVMRDAHYYMTSLPNESRLPRKPERRAMVAVIADGVGRGSWGEQASRLAIEVVTNSMLHNVGSYNTADAGAEKAFLQVLQTAAMQCQANVAQRAWDQPGAQGMATGLVLWVGIWPRAYTLCIGSSRVYGLIDGQLHLLSPPPDISRGLLGEGSSSPGAVILGQGWGQVGLMCSKGLTKHVSEEQIQRRLSAATSAKQACEQLLEDALSAGGTENITLVVGRTNPNRRG